ncbi:hypothetical protein [Leeia sp.]|uniref:hypothetical protein n=1 Tax=Leeia sp. TaxID=2884678 RepID=UPI0035B4448B
MLQRLSGALLLALLFPTLLTAAPAPAPITVPDQALGLFSRKFRSCTGGTTTHPPECVNKADWLLITPEGGDTVKVRFELTFANGHLCSAGNQFNETAVGRWEKQQLSVQISTSLGDRCSMQMRFTPRGVTFSDPGYKCTPLVCGARGLLNDFSLPRRGAFW